MKSLLSGLEVLVSRFKDVPNMGDKELHFEETLARMFGLKKVKPDTRDKIFTFLNILPRLSGFSVVHGEVIPDLVNESWVSSSQHHCFC
ncbi:hypothetical protein N24_2135 [Corynebacterium suranareeae]|uniref:Uncharacterized protein n=1 Tax=Corynebacterium suranareeae TaxID=2506452 RepID=A0A160PQL2_9CORY|nr:hypothetical protein N24_2135 [Corynebacterium suranareeae]